MKNFKYLILAALILILPLPALSVAETSSSSAAASSKRPQISIKSPAGGSSYAAGDTINILIQRKSERTAVTLILSPLGNGTRGISLPQPSRTGILSWKIPATTAAGAYVLIAKSNEEGEARINIAIKPKPVPVTQGMTLLQPPYQIASSQYPINTVDVIANVPLVKFVVKSEATSSIASVSARMFVGSSTASSAKPTMPVTAYLYEGSSTLLKSRTVPASGEVTFDGLNAAVLSGQSREYTVSADMPSNTVGGTTVVGSVTKVVPASGSVSSSSASIVTGNPMKFVTAGAVGIAHYTAAGMPTVTLVSGSVVARFTMQMNAVAGPVPAPKSNDFKILFSSVSASGTPGVAPESVSVVTIPDSQNVAEGSVVSVTVTAIKKVSSLPAGLYIARLSDAGQTVNLVTPNAANVDGGHSKLGFLSNLKASVIDSFKALFGIFGF